MSRDHLDGHKAFVIVIVVAIGSLLIAPYILVCVTLRRIQRLRKNFDALTKCAGGSTCVPHQVVKERHKLGEAGARLAGHSQPLNVGWLPQTILLRPQKHERPNS
jgi:hypothetical protein